MPHSSINKQSPIIIVGAGIFGLSSALHLLDAGYQSVTIFDSQDFHISGYSRSKGADSSSSDISKIIRSAYGSSLLYQNLAIQAIDVWKSWSKSSPIPLFVNCGWARLNDEVALDALEVATQNSIDVAALSQTQYNLGDASERARAEKDGWGGHRLDQFQRLDRGLPNWGVLDSLAGFTHADAACRFVLELVQSKGGKTVFGASGEFQEFVKTESRVTGIKTADGKSHSADLVILAAGPHSPKIVPGISKMIKITPTSVFELEVPEHSWDRYRPDVFPVWVWNRKIGGFPVNGNGILKLLYDNTEYLEAGLDKQFGATSRPISATTIASSGFLDSVPPELQAFIRKQIPELADVKISGRLCWYTDTFDGNFVIDYVPGLDGVLAVTGGARHGFKFLPVLGKYVVDVLEKRENDYTRLWKWREPEADYVEAKGVPTA